MNLPSLPCFYLKERKEGSDSNHQSVVVTQKRFNGRVTKCKIYFEWHNATVALEPMPCGTAPPGQSRLDRSGHLMGMHSLTSEQTRTRRLSKLMGTENSNGSEHNESSQPLKRQDP